MVVAAAALLAVWATVQHSSRCKNRTGIFRCCATEDAKQRKEHTGGAGNLVCHSDAAACEQQQSVAAAENSCSAAEQHMHKAQQEACQIRRLLHDAAAMGAGAGVAAAFTAPMAGE